MRVKQAGNSKYDADSTFGVHQRAHSLTFEMVVPMPKNRPAAILEIAPNSALTVDAPSGRRSIPAAVAAPPSDAFRVNRNLVHHRIVWAEAEIPVNKLDSMTDVFTVIRDAARGTCMVLP